VSRPSTNRQNQIRRNVQDVPQDIVLGEWQRRTLACSQGCNKQLCLLVNMSVSWQVKRPSRFVANSWRCLGGLDLEGIRRIHWLKYAAPRITFPHIIRPRCEWIPIRTTHFGYPLTIGRSFPYCLIRFVDVQKVSYLLLSIQKAYTITCGAIIRRKGINPPTWYIQTKRILSPLNGESVNNEQC
jgi:hypothetical protein